MRPRNLKSTGPPVAAIFYEIFLQEKRTRLSCSLDQLLKSTGIFKSNYASVFVVLGVVNIFSVMFAGADISYHSVQDLSFSLFTLIMSVTISSATSQSLKASILFGFCLPMRLSGILPNQNTVIESQREINFFMPRICLLILAVSLLKIL